MRQDVEVSASPVQHDRQAFTLSYRPEAHHGKIVRTMCTMDEVRRHPVGSTWVDHTMNGLRQNHVVISAGTAEIFGDHVSGIYESQAVGDPYFVDECWYCDKPLMGHAVDLSLNGWVHITCDDGEGLPHDHLG